MEFKHTEKPTLQGNKRHDIRLQHGNEVITGLRAQQSARVLRAAGSEWTSGNYEPFLDEEALTALEEWIERIELSPMSHELRKDLVSAREHLKRLRHRQALVDEMFDGDVSRLSIRQGKIGTCYHLAPAVSLHLNPALLWALTPEVFEMLGEDHYRLHFPSIQRIHGSEYPKIRDIPGFRADIAEWAKDFSTQGSRGDIALERAYASVIATGEHGGFNRTRRHNSDGKMAVEGGYPDRPLASLMPSEWLVSSGHSGLAYEGMDAFEKSIKDPRELCFYWIASRDRGQINMDGAMIHKRHAYGFGELKNGKLRLYNPHNPAVELWVSLETLKQTPEAYLSRVKLNYKASPLLDHARMVKDLPSERYQVQYLQNVMATHYSELHKLIMVENDPSKILLARSEFLGDPNFGTLFEKAGLQTFLDAYAANRPSPISSFQVAPVSYQSLPPLLAGTGLGLLGVSLGVVAIASLISRDQDIQLPLSETVNCPASAAGSWEFIRGVDVLNGSWTAPVDLNVLVAQEGPDHPAVTILDYPIACLDGHAPYSVAAQMPVVNDTVVVTVEGKKGTYHFHPDPANPELARMRKESQITTSVIGDRNGWTLICNGTEAHLATLGCVEEVSRWNASAQK